MIKRTKKLFAAVMAAATIFSGTLQNVYGATLVNTSEVEGEVLLTTDSPFTDLTYTHESKFEGYELFNGIDVSKWENYQYESGEIDWAACKEAGVDFAFVRVGYRTMASGEIKEDPYYKQNIEGALANDISVGVYFFSEALTTAEAKAEAKFVLKCIKDYDITFPIVFDYEGGYYTSNGTQYPGRVEKAYQDGTLNKDAVTKIARAYCKYIANAGYTPMVYASSNGLLNNVDGAALGEDYQIWQARYAQSTNPKNGYLYYEGNYSYWQYTESGYIGTMQVDCNFLYKNFNVKTNAPSVSDQTQDSITLQWDKTADALGYYVYRLDPDTGKYSRIGTTRECTYTDTELSAGSEYTYKIRAYWTIGGKNYTAKMSSTVSGSTTAKSVKNLTMAKRTASSITLSWKAVSRAKGYKVYQYDKSQGEYIEIASISGKSNTSYKVTDLSGSKEYKFIVRAYTKYDGRQLLGAASEELTVRTNPVKVENLTASARTSKSITLGFAKQSRVTGYLVYRYNADTGKWKKIGSSKDGTFTDDTVAANTSYQYRVRAYKESGGNTIYGKYSEVLTVKTTKAKKKS